MILFASDAQIAAMSRAPWIGGVFMSIFIGSVSVAFFLLSRGDEIFTGD